MRHEKYPRRPKRRQRLEDHRVIRRLWARRWRRARRMLVAMPADVAAEILDTWHGSNPPPARPCYLLGLIRAIAYLRIGRTATEQMFEAHATNQTSNSNAPTANY